MTIQQERDIAVAALERIRDMSQCEYSRNVATQAIAAIGAQASPVAQDELKMKFIASITCATSLGENRVYDLADILLGHVSASVTVPAAQKMTDDDIKEEFNSKNECYEFPSDDMRRGALNQFAWGAWFGYRRAIASQPAAQPVGEAVAEVRDGGLSGPAIAALVSWEKLQDGMKLYTAPPVAQDQDAARYRWLRSHHKRENSEWNLRWYLPMTMRGDGLTWSERLDASIDAAMKVEVKS